jgi:hypothetical protein
VKDTAKYKLHKAQNVSLFIIPVSRRREKLAEEGGIGVAGVVAAAAAVVAAFSPDCCSRHCSPRKRFWSTERRSHQSGSRIRFRLKVKVLGYFISKYQI